MQSHVVTIAQQKGGAGKTTLAAQLAVTWAKAGQTVSLVDVDPQGSLSAWWAVRDEALGAANTIRLEQVSGWKVASTVDSLSKDSTIVIIDSPPHAETDARVAIRAADIVLIPLQPSPMDLWATQPTIDLVHKENGEMLLVLNRMPPRGKLPDAINAQLHEGGLPVADTTLGSRVAFANSMMVGKGVLETESRSTAADEVVHLAGELTKRLAKVKK